MKYYISGHDRNTAVMDMLICRLPDEPHERTADVSAASGISSVDMHDGVLRAEAKVVKNGIDHTAEEFAPFPDEEDRVRVVSYLVKTSLYKALLPILDKRPNWGSITGVKPAKAARIAIENVIFASVCVGNYHKLMANASTNSA